MDFKSPEEARAIIKQATGMSDEDIDAELAAQRLTGGAGNGDLTASQTKTRTRPDTFLTQTGKDIGSMVGEGTGLVLGKGKVTSAMAGSAVGRAVAGAAMDMPAFVSGDMSPKELALRASLNAARGGADSLAGNAFFGATRWLTGGGTMSEDARNFASYIQSKLPDLPSGSWRQPWNAVLHPLRTITGTTKPAAATPDILTDNKMWDTFGNIVRTSMFGGRRTAALDVRNNDILDGLGDDLSKAFGTAMNKDDFGKFIVKAINDQTVGVEAAGQTAKNTAAQMGKGLPVNLSSVTTPLKKMQKLGTAVAADPMNPVKMLDDAQQQILDTLGSEAPLDKVIEFRDAMRVKNQPQMVKQLDGAIMRSLKKDPQARNAYKEYMDMTSLTDDQQSALNNSFVRGLVSQVQGKGGYESIADVLRPASGPDQAKNLTNIRRLKDFFDINYTNKSQAFGNPWRQVQALFNKRIFEKAYTMNPDGTTELRGAQLLPAISSPEMKDLISEVYSPDYYKNLVSFAKNLATTQASQGGRGKFGTEVREQGALGRVTTRAFANLLPILGLGAAPAVATHSGAMAAGLASTAMIPKALDYALTDPVFVKLVTEGMGQPRMLGKTRVASMIAARWLRHETEAAMNGGQEYQPAVEGAFGPSASQQ